MVNIVRRAPQGNHRIAIVLPAARLDLNPIDLYDHLPHDHGHRTLKNWAIMEDGKERGFWGKDGLLLGTLLILALVLRVAIVGRTEVPARDSIGFIRFALDFERLPWNDVLRKHQQHPGYPLTILMVSWPLRAVLGTTPEALQLSAQVASSIAGWLLVIPMYFLGKMLANRATGFWSGLLVQCLPASGQILSDGLSEALFLLLFAFALWAAILAMERRSAGLFALCGTSCGLAYLTRPEGLLVLFAIALVLAARQFLGQDRSNWKRWYGCTASLLLPAIALAGIYMATIQRLTNKPSGDGFTYAANKGACTAPSNSSPLLVAAMFTPRDDWLGWVEQSVGAIGSETAQAFHYYWVIPLFIGMASLYRSRGFLPGDWPLITTSLLHIIVLGRLAMTAGYVSDRHVMILVLIGSIPAAVGIQRMAFWLACHIHRIANGPRAASCFATCLPAILIAMGLPKTMEPMHGNRAGHHAAGNWLARHIRPGDTIRDEHCWAHFYAGQVFREGQSMPDNGSARCFTVISRSRNADIDRMRHEVEEDILARGGTIEYYWPEQRDVSAARVVVYSHLCSRGSPCEANGGK
jgi:hypothetical protein